ncbi:MAG: hypothetical protein V1644_02980 [Candidatus Micrarchaeota archaeon]
MVKSTFKGGELIGTINYAHLPSKVRVHLAAMSNSHLLASTARLASSAFGAGVATVGEHLVRNAIQPGSPIQDRIAAASTLAVGAAAIAVPIYSAISRGRRLEKAKFKAIGVLMDEGRRDPLIQGFLEKGATHVVVGKQGQLHFISAPHNRTVVFKPVFREVRHPI